MTIEIGAAACLLVGLFAGCERSNAAVESSSPVRVDGSSTVYLVSLSQAKEYQKAGLGHVDVAESGTTGGFRKFCSGEVAVTGASRPITQDELARCRAGSVDFIELPIGYDGISLVVHRTNTWASSLTVAELKAIWEPGSKIATWKQVRSTFPDRPLHLYGPGKDSGTFDYFTLAVNGAERASRNDYTASEDDNVLVNGVASDEGGLGYFGFAYFVENWDKLKLVAIGDGNAANGDGPVLPSQESIANGTYQPLARPIFIYVSVPASTRPEVERFVTFYLKHARKLVADAGYIALPAKGDEMAMTRYRARKTGTAFTGGSKLGVLVEDLYAAESK